MFNMHLPLRVTALAFSSTVDVLTTRDPEAQEEEEQDTPIYDKHDNLLHGDKTRRK